MSDSRQYSVQGAREAGERDELAGWVERFLSSEGSDNPLLGQKLTQELGWWAGPVQLPLDRLHRLAGPPGHPVEAPVDEDYWDDRVGDMAERVKDGWEPAPVVVAYRQGDLALEDGNHRVESLRQAGRDSAWAVVGFERQEDRDRFMQEWAGPPSADRN